jgi:hypothetical protein
VFVRVRARVRARHLTRSLGAAHRARTATRFHRRRAYRSKATPANITFTFLPGSGTFHSVPSSRLVRQVLLDNSLRRFLAPLPLPSFSHRATRTTSHAPPLPRTSVIMIANFGPTFGGKLSDAHTPLRYDLPWVAGPFPSARA